MLPDSKLDIEYAVKPAIDYVTPIFTELSDHASDLIFTPEMIYSVENTLWVNKNGQVMSGFNFYFTNVPVLGGGLGVPQEPYPQGTIITNSDLLWETSSVVSQPVRLVSMMNTLTLLSASETGFKMFLDHQTVGLELSYTDAPFGFFTSMRIQGEYIDPIYDANGVANNNPNNDVRVVDITKYHSKFGMSSTQTAPDYDGVSGTVDENGIVDDTRFCVPYNVGSSFNELTNSNPSNLRQVRGLLLEGNKIKITVTP